MGGQGKQDEVRREVRRVGREGGGGRVGQYRAGGWGGRVGREGGAGRWGRRRAGGWGGMRAGGRAKCLRGSLGQTHIK